MSIAACTSPTEVEPANHTRIAPPTQHPLFAIATEDTREGEATRDLFGAPPIATLPLSPSVTNTPLTDTPSVTITPITAVSALVTTTVTIYDETLNSAWTLNNSQDHDYSIFNTDFPHNGRNNMSITPLAEYGEIGFTVRPESSRNYPRANVLGVRFWLNSGAEFMENDDLLVSISGSDTLPYYDPDDDSVEPIVNDGPTFSETRLYFLNVNGDIPAGTWIRVDVWLDDLQYDPIYEYITGIWIINDEDFFQTYYIDEVQLIMVVDE